jgi:hypothetical protein
MDYGKAAAASLVVCGALLLVGCKHPPVELGHDVKVVCIEDQSGSNEELHLKEGRTTFQFGRSLVPNRFRLKELREADFPWRRARYLKRLSCGKSYTWNDLQTGNSAFKCVPGVASTEAQHDTKTKTETETESDSESQDPDACKSTCGDDPYSRVQGRVKLHTGASRKSKMVAHCVQLYDVVASDGHKAGVLMKLHHSEGDAHAGYAHGEEQ